ncbi:GNAT family N-acetyltransferase [Mammaliicoccus sciuri]|uniref:GNAT family N-acetyltransferase n=1 Tax=Mammaliicoccus sciuri TaxID=1296 RepID=UPI00066D6463|nr:GNAT family protein [Mammaliicoccus sciuri]HCW36178.1 N-acetyltransferase [Staphylococcus sp.]MCD3218656.1 GNAT family N-acetyltransferase [Mammaliicoccus sciuri]MCJ0908212.1 GNAT family N-acetyltransferase [Mammaliicoccus sciuri]MCJ0924508.1 GNAT family N-acetyltransferase [Mammaliicoccus sciuri]MCJ1760717.1 GNAT family N-acetyltransferase [Mammaliicoccus sciuri]
MIEIRPVEMNDASELLDIDVRNRALFESYSAADRKDSDYQLYNYRKIIDKHLQDMTEDKGYHYVIVHKEDNKVIGTIDLFAVVRHNIQGCMMGYALDAAYNGKGITTLAAKEVIRIAFNELGFHRVEAGVQPTNIGSVRVLEKAGMIREGLNRSNVRINGEWKDHYLYAIVNENY